MVKKPFEQATVFEAYHHIKNELLPSYPGSREFLLRYQSEYIGPEMCYRYLFGKTVELHWYKKNENNTMNVQNWFKKNVWDPD